MTVKRWGNSLAIRIPKDLADDLEVAAGTRVEFAVTRMRRRRGQGKAIREVVLRFEAAPKPRKLTLAALMAKFKPEHRHGEWDLGKPVGKEVW